MLRPAAPPSDAVFLAWVGLGASLLLAAGRDLVPGSGAWIVSVFGWILFAVGARSPRRAATIFHGLGVVLLARPWLDPAFPRGTDVGGSNAEAGAAALFLAVWACRAARADGVRRAVFALLALGAALALWGHGSRGGLAAAIVGVAVAWISGAGRGRRLAVGAAIGLLVATALGALVAPQTLDALGRRWMLEDQLEGPSVESVLSGRPEIWRRAAFAFVDLPYGAGPGAFPRLADALYPGLSSAPEHAHQLLLHLGLSLGLPGLLATLALWLACARRILPALKDPTDPDRRSVAAAWLGGFSAYQAFGVADCLPVHGVVGLAPWALLGWAASLPATHPPRARTAAGTRLATARRVGIGAGIAGLLLVGWTVDRAQRPAVRTLLEAAQPGGSMSIQGLGNGPKPPGSRWILGLLHHRSGNAELRDRAWLELIEKTDRRLPLLRALPAARHLAPAAVEQRPESCEAWFWLGDESTGEAAIRAYAHGLELCPRRGREWLRLGDLLSVHSPRRALDAYAQACRHGDPGANGCLRAGAVAETLGEPERAAELYGRSRLPQAQEKARSLGSHP